MLDGYLPIYLDVDKLHASLHSLADEPWSSLEVNYLIAKASLR